MNLDITKLKSFLILAFSCLDPEESSPVTMTQICGTLVMYNLFFTFVEFSLELCPQNIGSFETSCGDTRPQKEIGRLKVVRFYKFKTFNFNFPDINNSQWPLLSDQYATILRLLVNLELLDKFPSFGSSISGGKALAVVLILMTYFFWKTCLFKFLITLFVVQSRHTTFNITIRFYDNFHILKFLYWLNKENLLKYKTYWLQKAQEKLDTI